MKKTKMNPRMKAILQRLCKESSYVAIAEIAKEVAVSAKTVMRELPEAERLLATCGVRLEKKTGVGIGIQGGDEAKQRVLVLLDQTESEPIFSPQERQTVIISKLLQNQAPVKLYEFTSTLKVTEGTISNDLDKLESWFSGRMLTLVRKPGLGIYIEGKEQNIRKAIVHYIYEHMNEEELLTFFYENLEGGTADHSVATLTSKQYLLNLVDTEIIRGLERAIRESEGEMSYKLSDGALIGLIVHLALAIQRIRKNEKIEIDAVLLMELREKREFSIAENIAKRIAHRFVLFVPDDEIGYITMHILGARNHYGRKNTKGKIIDNFHLVRLAQAMMKIAQEESGQPLSRSEKLLVGLVNHLGPSISRLQLNLEIRNPLLKDMQEQYPALLEISRKCARVVEDELGKKLPEAEIAYIAMHLGAALADGEAVPKRKHRVAVACPTGMGTSRMLATRIRKEYDNLEIVGSISAIQIDEARLKELGAAFIISTVSIRQVSLPVVVVNSLLRPEDRGRIDRQTAMLERTGHSLPMRPREPLHFKERLSLLCGYGRAIVAVLDNFFLMEDLQAATVEEAIGSVACHLECESDAREALAAALAERESYGGTGLAAQNMTLLHCRDNAVRKLQFGVVHLKNFAGAAEAPHTALVLLAPANSDKSEIETIGHISALLLERWGFAEILHKGDKAMIYQELIKIFTEFYRRKNKELMEEWK